MVGDTPVNLRAAKAAGALMVGVLSGLAGPQDLRSADLVIPCVTQLGNWLPPLAVKPGAGQTAAWAEQSSEPSLFS